MIRCMRFCRWPRCSERSVLVSSHMRVYMAGAWGARNASAPGAERAVSVERALSNAGWETSPHWVWDIGVSYVYFQLQILFCLLGLARTFSRMMYAIPDKA